ncbi:MAG TPA: HD-GYP domain-containing protein [Alphaproteobacteria bacterium]|nr:HD-GYP domain-containing protein [Alphaproteobacteria bacterium]
MRFDFVARFAAVLLVCAIGIAAALSFFFARAHLDALKRDLITTAVGQASAALQPSIERYASGGSMTASARKSVDEAASNVENFNPLVRGVRLYSPAGDPLDPSAGVSVSGYASAAVAQQNVVQSPAHEVRGESLVTAYVPLVGPSGKYVAVAAVDVSVGQLEAQAGQETNFVVISTLIACSVIFLSLLTLAAAAQRELNRRGHAAETTFLQTMQGIATIVDQRDPYTAGHSHRVADYSVAIAGQLGLSRAQIDTVRWSALLHDLGKIGIPDAVLLKPGPFDEREREIINHHPGIARDILGQVDAMSEIVPCVLHHHERWDGRGYPDGLAGEKIPILSRVIAVADTFDAMTTDRPYRDALTLDEARRRLSEGAAVQWCARCIGAIIELIDAGKLVPPAVHVRQFGQRLSVSDVYRS